MVPVFEGDIAVFMLRLQTGRRRAAGRPLALKSSR